MQVGKRFLIHQWSDGCAVFDQTSGNTHSLDLATCAGFLAAQNNASVCAAIEGAIRAQWPEKNVADVAVLVQGCLERLEACGLTEAGKRN